METKSNFIQFGYRIIKRDQIEYVLFPIGEYDDNDTYLPVGTHIHLISGRVVECDTQMIKDEFIADYIREICRVLEGTPKQ